MPVNREEKVLIIGSSGLLGSNLSFSLRGKSNLTLTQVSRQSSPTTTHTISSYDRAVLRELIDEFMPSVVVNCVGVVGHDKVNTSPEIARQANLEIPAHLAELTQDQGIRFVHFSSDSVYSGNPRKAPFSETSETRPFSLYGHQKLESESVVLERHPGSLVLRVNFFGWSQSGTKGMLDHFAYHAVRETRPIGYSRYFVTSIYTGNLAKVLVGALEGGLVGIFNLGSSNSLSKFEFGRTFFGQTNRDVDDVIAGDPSFWAADGTVARDLSMSSEKIERALGIKVASQEEGIAQALNELEDYLEFFHCDIDDPRAQLLESRSPQ